MVAAGRLMPFEHRIARAWRLVRMRAGAVTPKDYALITPAFFAVQVAT